MSKEIQQSDVTTENKNDDAVPDTPVESTEIPSVMAASSGQPVNKSRKMLIFAVVWALVVITGAVAWQLNWFDQDTNQQASQAPPVEVAEQKELTPYGVIYTATEDGEFSEEQSCTPTRTKLMLQPFDGDPVELFDAGQNNYVAWLDTHENLVAFEAGPSCDSVDKTAIWLSKDGGQTFNKVYEGSGLQDDLLGDQFTSIEFSQDGKSLLAALLPASSAASDTTQNIVKEIDIASGTVKDLFTVDEIGVFIEGYDREQKNVYYYTGCFNCDGNTRSQLLVRNLETDEVATVYDIGDRLTVHSEMNDDFTKLLVVMGSVNNDGLGDGPPYDLVEFDVVSGKQTKLLDVPEDQYITAVGYHKDSGQPYYMENNKLIALGGEENGVLFETETPFHQVFLIDSKAVIASTGDYEKQSIFRYGYNEQAITSLKTLPQTYWTALIWR